MRSLLIGLMPFLAVAASAQLPDPPPESEVRALVNRLQMQAAGNTTPETRQRLEDEVAACVGDPSRLDNAAGLIIFLHGYPWEGMWFLTRSAVRDLEQPDVINNMGLVLTLVEEPDDAERLLLYAVNEWPDFHPAWTNLARLYVDAEEYDNAQECIDHVNDACPGNTSAEELGMRVASQQRNSTQAAEHAVNLSNLDPGNPMLAEARPHIEDSDIVNEVAERTTAVPMPLTFVELDEIIDDYEDFALDEMDRRYWQTAANRFAEIGTATPRQTIERLPPEVFNQLPPEMQAQLLAMGAGPEQPLEVLSPTESRTHYLRLGMFIDRYRKAYQQQISPPFRESAVQATIDRQRERCHEYHDEYVAALEAGDDPIAAANEYCRDVIGAMNAAHAGFLEAIAEARASGSRLTSRHWRTTAGLITMVPEEHRGEEIDFLRRQASLSSLYYTGAVVQWYSIGSGAVMLDRILAGATADALHGAASSRELDALIVRERLRADLEAELDAWEEVSLSHIHPWIGLNLGFFSIKFEYEQVGISVGEGVVGDVQYNWANEQLELGIGIGVEGPGLGPLGSSAKGLGVLRIGGDHIVAVGFRENIQAAVASPVAGVDIDLSDEYVWGASAGRPDLAAWH